MVLWPHPSIAHRANRRRVLPGAAWSQRGATGPVLSSGHDLPVDVCVVTGWEVGAPEVGVNGPVERRCADRDALVGWERRLDDLCISHGGIVDAHYGSGLSFRDPDGIALEFFAPPASAA